MRLLHLAIASVACLSSVAPSLAETVRLTIYDDGLSCPGNCDAHVVFHASMNGTEFAHDPTTPTGPFSKCASGNTCTICLESGGKQCLEVMYRGGGPSPKTFDFTPRFYEAACASTPQQPQLARKCADLKRAAAALNGRQNCIAKPDSELCKAVLAAATEMRAVDRPEYESCKAIGEEKYNQGKPAERQRALNCAYELKGTGGPNSKGVTWRKLLPGACREGTFVGRDGLDCCSGSTLADGPLGLECIGFYPKAPSS